jgi:hypothetical protein
MKERGTVTQRAKRYAKSENRKSKVEKRTQDPGKELIAGTRGV